MIFLFILAATLLPCVSTKILNQLLIKKYPKYKHNCLNKMIILSLAINLIIQPKLFTKMNEILLTNNENIFYYLTFILALLMTIISSCLAIDFIIDLLYFELPNEINLLIGVLLIPISLFIYSGRTFITAITIFIIYMLLALFTDSFGMGDAKLALALGLGIKFSLLNKFMFVSFLLGSIYSVAKIIKHKTNLKTEIAFGPFIILGFLSIF